MAGENGIDKGLSLAKFLKFQIRIKIAGSKTGGKRSPILPLLLSLINYRANSFSKKEIPFRSESKFLCPGNQQRTFSISLLADLSDPTPPIIVAIPRRVVEGRRDRCLNRFLLEFQGKPQAYAEVARS